MYSMLSVSYGSSGCERLSVSTSVLIEWVPASPLAESCTWSEIANVAWACTQVMILPDKILRNQNCNEQEETHRLHESKHTYSEAARCGTGGLGDWHSALCSLTTFG